ncbi:MAG: class I SAM-dependent methyltransferase [Nitrospinota bacterium]
MTSRQEQWQLSGNAPEAYERYLVPAVLAPLAEGLVELVSLKPGQRALDVACGTGIVARLAARRVGADGKVIGLDLNPGMLAVARSIPPPPPPPGASIEWQRGSADALGFADGSFDVVLCQQGLQYFPDKPAALREMRRVLVPGGRLALSVVRPIEHSPGHAALADALERHVSSEAAGILRAGFGFGDAEALRALIAGAGFRGVVIRRGVAWAHFPSPEEFVRRQVEGSPLARPVAEAEGARDALVSDLRVALQPYVKDTGLKIPVETNHAVGHG